MRSLRSVLFTAGTWSCLVVPSLAQGGGPPPIKVSLAPAVMRHFQPALETTAETRAVRESRVGAEIEGSVQQMHVEEGTAVTTGELLVQFKRSLREIMKTRAEAQLELAQQQLKEYEAGSREEDLREAQAAVDEATSLLEEADKEVARLEGLRKTEVVSEREYSEARTDAAKARAAMAQSAAKRDRVLKGPRAEVLARARADVAIQAANLALIQDELDKTEAKAPFDGVVVEKHVEAGHRVGKGETLLSLVQMDPIHVIAAVPESSIDGIQVGASVAVRLDPMSSEMLTGQVVAIVPRADLRARTYPVKVALANPDHRILPGMTARVRFTLPGGVDAVAVPRDALVRSTRGTMVYTVVDGKAVPRPVVLGQEDGDWVAVTSGLEEGTQVVVRGNEMIRPGQGVVVLEDENGQ